MDLKTTINQEIIRPFVTMFVPGFVLCWVVVGYCRDLPTVLPFEDATAGGWFAAVFVVVSVAAGVVLGHHGSWIEAKCLDARANVVDENFYKRWDAYLGLKRSDDPNTIRVAHRYISDKVLVLKFQLNVCVACVLGSALGFTLFMLSPDTDTLPQWFLACFSRPLDKTKVDAIFSTLHIATDAEFSWLLPTVLAVAAWFEFGRAFVTHEDLDNARKRLLLSEGGEHSTMALTKEREADAARETMLSMDPLALLIVWGFRGDPRLARDSRSPYERHLGRSVIVAVAALVSPVLWLLMYLLLPTIRRRPGPLAKLENRKQKIASRSNSDTEKALLSALLTEDCSVSTALGAFKTALSSAETELDAAKKDVAEYKKLKGLGGVLNSMQA